MNPQYYPPNGRAESDGAAEGSSTSAAPATGDVPAFESAPTSYAGYNYPFPPFGGGWPGAPPNGAMPQGMPQGMMFNPAMLAAGQQYMLPGTQFMVRLSFL